MLSTTLFNPTPSSFATKLPPLRSSISPYCSLSEERRVNSERVISLLEANGLTENHIARVTRVHPKVVFADPQKTLAPNIDFLLSTGISNTDLPEILSTNPTLLQSSLMNQLIPCHHYLESVLHSEENAVKLIKRCSGILRCRVDKVLAPNISLLSEIGVSESKILYMLMRDPFSFQLLHAKFKSKVEQVISWGFNPMRYVFVDALSVLCVVKKTTFDRKWAAYKKWNLSDDEIRLAFRTCPNCMRLSEERIARVMDFFVNKMGFEAAKVAGQSGAFLHDLENRIIPRGRVVQVLIAHGMLKKDIRLSTILRPSETEFLLRFVSKYEHTLPWLLKIYEGKMECLETGIGSITEM